MRLKPETIPDSPGSIKEERRVATCIVIFCKRSFSLSDCARQPLIAASAAEPPLRIVPQIGWAAQGLASPDGLLFVSGMRESMARSLRLVSKEGVLLWAIPLYLPADAAFSPDRRWLAACGAEEGLLLDLRSSHLRRFPTLRGLLTAFTPDSQRVIVVRHSVGLRDLGDGGLLVFDLDGRRTARLPVEMSVPHTMEVSADRQDSPRPRRHGNPAMHMPRMGKAEETLHLDTGKSERNWGPIAQGWMRTARTRGWWPCRTRSTNSQAAVHKKLFWNEASGLCLLSPFALWDIRSGRFLGDMRRLNLSEVSGWLDRDTLLATTWKDGKSSLSLVHVRSGEVSATGLPPQRVLLAPGGNSFFYCADRQNPYAARLELRHTPQGTPVYEETTDLFVWDSATWSRDGRYLACLRSRKAGPAVRLVAAADGKVVDVPLGDVVAAHTKDPDSPPHIWRLAMDDTGDRVAVGMGWINYGLVAIVSRKSRAVEAVVDGLPNLIQALQFVGHDRLLTGSGNGQVQLWDLARRQPLWTTETREDPLQFDYVPGGRYVVCTNLSRSGTVLRMDDGKVVYKAPPLLASDSPVVLPWSQPQLVGGGEWALDMDCESMQVRLLDLAAGKTALSYCTLPEDQWIVYTPDGDWVGSERALQWVTFCRGLRPLPPSEAAGRRDGERIKAVLQAAFTKTGGLDP